MLETDHLDEVIATIKKSWSKETSFTPEKWTSDNPARGQCAVTSLLLTEWFDGDVWEGHVMDGDEHYLHFVADIPGIGLVDATRSQFKELKSMWLYRIVDKDDLLSNPWFTLRYEKLFQNAVLNHSKSHASHSRYTDSEPALIEEPRRTEDTL